MAKKRIAGSARKALILEAARQVFSRSGYDATKTIEIARAAKVSEALVYRHFPSKEALYRAVLRQTIREQDENFAALGLREPNTAGIVRTLKLYFSFAAGLAEEQMQYRFRLLLASLSGDGNYASLVYRRSQRMIGRTISDALANAHANGDMTGAAISPGSSAMFVEHIGTMMSAIHSLSLNSLPYANSGEQLVRDAVWFCCRGMGFTDEAIARHIDD